MDKAESSKSQKTEEFLPQIKIDDFIAKMNSLTLQYN